LLRGTDEVATTDGFISDVATFVLDTPYVIDEGQTKTFYVRADVDGGRSTDNVIIYLDENTDLIAVDQQYGFGAAVINNFSQALANTVALEGGDVTVVDNGPAATQIAQNADNIELLNFSVTTARDLTVRDTFIQLDIQDSLGIGPDLTAPFTSGVEAGTSTLTQVDVTANQTGWEIGDMLQVPTASGTEYTVVTAIPVPDTSFTVSPALTGLPTAAGTVTEVNPYDYVRNVKLVDLDSGNTLAGPLTDGNAGSTLVGGVPSSYSKVHTEDYEFTGGDTRHLSIQVDLDQNMASGYQIRAQVRFSDGVSTSSYVKDLDANEFVATANIIGAGATALAGNFMITAQNNLAASTASTPTSQSYVKGDATVPALGIALTAGDAGDITIKRLNVRMYGCDGTDDGPGAGNTAGIQCFEDLLVNNDWESALGNVAANTIVASITLYDGNDVVAGPESVNLVDPGSNGYTAGTDYYIAQFDDLNMMIPAGGTKTLTAKVNLLNSAVTQNFLALDLDPSADIIAEDDDANTITPTGIALNGAVNKVPVITILTSGDLTASSEGNPDEDVLVSGSTQQLVSKYRFNAIDEDFQVRKLTVVNDDATTTTDFGNDPVLSSAIAQVVVKYPDVNGVTQTASSSLSGTGQAKFAGLDFYVPAGEDAFLEVYADVNTKALVGESLSGKKFRLGLQNTGNDITSFEAIGQSSSTNLNFTGAPTTKVTNSANVNEFVVRKSIPTFANVSSSTSLANGEKTMFSYSVTADSAGSVSFGRMVFDIDMTDAGGVLVLDLDEFKFYKGSSLVTQAEIYGALAGDVGIGAGTLGGDDSVIVSFAQEESVAAGSSQTYSLKASVVNSENDDTVDTKINIGDENEEVGFGTGETPILATSVCGTTDLLLCSTGNGNTGRVYDSGVDEALLFASDTEFLDTATANRNIIWSDKSADAHAYPTICTGAGAPDAACSGAGALVRGSGSYDWTNGYLLDITDLSSHSLEK
jgi:hypothetical protein